MAEDTETLALLARAQAGDQRARNALIVEHLGLVHQIVAQVARQTGRQDLREEMAQAAVAGHAGDGREGLVRAIELFDAARGCRFATYARPWIAKACQRCVNHHAAGGVAGRGTIERRSRIRRVHATLAGTANGAPVQPEEVHAELARTQRAPLTLATVRRAIEEPLRVAALDELPDAQSTDDEAAIVRNLEHERIVALLDDESVGLTPTERAVIRWRFGLHHPGARCCELSEIAAELRISSSRVGALTSNALAKLRAALEEPHALT